MRLSLYLKCQCFFRVCVWDNGVDYMTTLVLFSVGINEALSVFKMSVLFSCIGQTLDEGLLLTILVWCWSARIENVFLEWAIFRSFNG
jgi:hypothetical protein